MPTIPDVVDLEEVGHGGDSVVYRGRHESLSVAVKLRRATDPNPEASRRRYRREAALLGTIHHPCLPSVFATGEVDGRPYLVRSFLEGRTLAETLARGRMAESRSLALAIDLAGALAAVHQRGLVHRDIKPSNVILGPDGRARLIDFGLAAVPLSEAPVAPAGTYLYAAPEQTGLLKRPVDARADLYALGVVLYEALTGTPPFQAASPAEVVRQHAAVPAPDVRTQRPDVSPAMALVVGRLLAKDPDDRYQSAASLLAELAELPSLNEAIWAGRPVQLGHGVVETGDPAPLAGREGELAALEAAWAGACRGGRPQVLLVHGESGMGKSRLLRVFVAAHAPPQGVGLEHGLLDGHGLGVAAVGEGLQQARMGRWKGHWRAMAPRLWGRGGC